jgi:hypothetical protein
MRILLPKNFGGLSVNGEPVSLEADEDGCVNVGADVAETLLSHGGQLAPDVTEENERIEQELEANEKHREVIHAKRQKGKYDR